MNHKFFYCLYFCFLSVASQAQILEAVAGIGSLIASAIPEKDPSVVRTKKVSEMEIFASHAMSVNGCYFALGIKVINKNGSESATKGLMKGELSWDNFKISTNLGVHVDGDKDGVFKIPLQDLGTEKLVVSCCLKDNESVSVRRQFDIPTIKGFDVHYTVSSDRNGFHMGDHVILEGEIVFSDGTRSKCDKDAIDVRCMSGQYNGVDYQSGLLLTKEDATRYPDNKLVMDVFFKKMPTLRKTIEIPLSFEGEQQIDFRGEGGYHGNDGRKMNGQNGTHGKDGHHTEVYVTMRRNEQLEKDMIWVAARSLSADYKCFYWVDPAKGSILINASGGNGGYGGDGRDGSGAGDGGDGGNGGNVTVYISPEAQDFSNRIKIKNIGGAAGYGGTASGYSSNGRNGRNGAAGQTPQKIVQAITMDWDNF